MQFIEIECFDWQGCSTPNMNDVNIVLINLEQIVSIRDYDDHHALIVTTEEGIQYVSALSALELTEFIQKQGHVITTIFEPEE